MFSVRFIENEFRPFRTKKFGLDSVSSRFKKVGNLFVSAIFDGILHNVLGLCEEGELEVKLFNLAQMLIELLMFILALLPLFRKTLVVGSYSILMLSKGMPNCLSNPDLTKGIKLSALLLINHL